MRTLLRTIFAIVCGVISYYLFYDIIKPCSYVLMITGIFCGNISLIAPVMASASYDYGHNIQNKYHFEKVHNIICRIRAASTIQFIALFIVSMGIVLHPIFTCVTIMMSIFYSIWGWATYNCISNLFLKIKLSSDQSFLDDLPGPYQF